MDLVDVAVHLPFVDKSALYLVIGWAAIDLAVVNLAVCVSMDFNNMDLSSQAVNLPTVDLTVGRTVTVVAALNLVTLNLANVYLVVVYLVELEYF